MAIKTILFLVAFVLFNSCNCLKKSRLYDKDENIVSMKFNQLYHHDLTKYLNQPIDSLLSVHFIKDYKSYFFADEPPAYVSNLTLQYTDSEKFLIEIYADKEFRSYDSNKKQISNEKLLEIYRKEKVLRIEIIYNYHTVNVYK